MPNIEALNLNLEEVRNIVFIGAGNVANILAPAFVNAGIGVSQVYSRKMENAEYLAKKIEAEPVSMIGDIRDNADLYIFSVSDSAIISILRQKNWQGKFLVHTAGSVPSDIFSPFTNKYGVIYPFQTFTKGRNIQVAETPFFIEASGNNEINMLVQLVNKISQKCIAITSQQREKIHLAGVFANNFSNFMFTISAEILKAENLPIEFIKPLIEETFRKAMEIDPSKAQTGPAIRDNIEIIQKHKELLGQHPDWQKIYTFVSESIQKYYHSNV